ncbi:MAG TPA: cupredoxin domain-containing protein [Candidatus Saccharimonadales bacterium]|jgi:hypothetical protein|nr:cupredoxin domain-containing protein [Candidatus Saccharimonadales bacterium]
MSGLSKRWKAWLIGTATLALMIATVPFAIWVTHTATAQVGNEKARCQSVMQPTHKVIIKNDQAIPAHTDAKQCDTLEIINEDNGIKLMAFGPHEHHVSYDGVSERVLGPGQNFSVRLIETGTFQFHDHSTDTAQGSFTVTS